MYDVEANQYHNPKKMSHEQLSSNNRVMLDRLFRAKITQKEMARILRIDESTISRELKRNKDKNGNYRAEIAIKKLKNRRTKANQKFKKIPSKSALRQYIVRKLKEYWSPEQIAGKLAQKYAKTVVCHETIYQFAYKDRPDLKQFLRCKKRKYRRRHGTVAREKNRKLKIKRIDARPKIVETRERIGDWEGDTIRGGDKKSAVLTHVERKSGYLIANRLKRALAKTTRKATVKEFSKIPKKKRYTITYDNGSEFAEHAIAENRLNMEVDFAYPYHSWERGTNENTNGLLRQFFPKGTDFTKISVFDLQKAVKLINNRPRKRLEYHTPKEIFLGKIAIRTRI
jgi:IS30 family transposase